MAPLTTDEDAPISFQNHIGSMRKRIGVAGEAKRRKLQHDSSPEPSTVSDDSALVPTSVPDDTTDATEIESNASSEVSDSSEEPSDESSDEDSNDSEDADMMQDSDGIINLRANRGEKPVMDLKNVGLGEDIRPFLKDFLPKLKAANEELEAQRDAGTLESAEIGEEDAKDSDGQYIELNLGLGVLETKDDMNESSSREGEDQDDAQDDILGKLMGQKKPRGAAGVQEVMEQENT